MISIMAFPQSCNDTPARFVPSSSEPCPMQMLRAASRLGYNAAETYR
jgi:hypothetical protein